MPPNPIADLESLRQRLSREGSLTLEIKVVPRAAQSEVTGLTADGVVKVKVAAAPEKGKANQELCSLLARCFEVAKGNVEVLTGKSSQHKRVRIRT